MPNSKLGSDRSSCYRLVHAALPGDREVRYWGRLAPHLENSKFWHSGDVLFRAQGSAVDRQALVALTTAFLIRPSATAQSVSPEPISRTRVCSCFFDPEPSLRI